MRRVRLPSGILLVSGLIAFACGCNKSESTTAKAATAETSANASSSSGASSASASSMEAEAKAAALAEIGRHWVQGPEGWTTARISGSPYAPDHYLRQIRKIDVAGVEADELSEADRMNGFEWSGQVDFQAAPCREAGDPGIVLEGVANVNVNRPKGRWSQWVDYTPQPLHLQRVKGKWQIPQDTWTLRGSVPTSQDYAKAGVH